MSPASLAAAGRRELRQRLKRADCPQEIGENGDWQTDISLAHMRELVAYQLEANDWHLHEAAMNTVPQFRTVIEEVPARFQHIRHKGPMLVPLSQPFRGIATPTG